MAAGKKAKKGKIPKQVLGMKVPKELRRAGDQLIETASTPQGREKIAGVLTMAAAAASAAVARASVRPPEAEPARRAADPEPASGAPQGTRHSPDPEAIAAAVGQAADAVLTRLFGKRT